MAEDVNNSGPVHEGISIALNQVAVTLGCIPAALIGALAFRNYDMMANHRSTVLKYHKLPGGKRAQRRLAIGMHIYGRKKPDPDSIEDLQGESFAAAEIGTLSHEIFTNLEYGRSINAKQMMAIPIGAGRRSLGPDGGVANKLFRSVLERKKFRITKDGVLLYRKRGTAEDLVMGVLKRKRDQKAMLGFYPAFERNVPKHLARYETDMNTALTAAGQASLDVDNKVRAAAEVAGNAAFKHVLSNFEGKGRAKFSAARKARKLAYDQAMKMGRSEV